jgi:hypothetical protein
MRVFHVTVASKSIAMFIATRCLLHCGPFTLALHSYEEEVIAAASAGARVTPPPATAAEDSMCGRPVRSARKMGDTHCTRCVHVLRVSERARDTDRASEWRGNGLDSTLSSNGGRIQSLGKRVAYLLTLSTSSSPSLPPSAAPPDGGCSHPK